MPNLYVEETYIDLTRNLQYGESGIYESDSASPGPVFRACRKEYGRCVSKVYIDSADGTKTMPIGWVFQKRRAYEDAPRKFYLAETWITLHQKPPTRSLTNYYVDLRRPSDRQTKSPRGDTP